MAHAGIALGVNLLIAIAPTQSGPATAPAAPPAVTVVVRDYADVTATVLQRAEGVATSVYRQIGIHIRWLHLEDLPTVQDADQAVPADACRPRVVLDLIPRGLERQTRPSVNALGSAVPSASWARVFVARVDAMAKKGNVHDRGQLLGHVLAHEAGHVLLGRNTHALAGLMAAELHVRQARQSALTFSPEEAATIHHNLRCGSKLA